jgi:hypothetical protein
MGYVHTLPYQELTVKSSETGIFTLVTVPASFDLDNIIIPTFTESLSYAFLDLHIQNWQNTNAAVNYITANGSFGIKDIGGTYRASANMSGYQCYVAGSGLVSSHQVLVGINDIKAYITSGATQAVSVAGVRSALDDLKIRSTYGELRLYFGVS